MSISESGKTLDFGACLVVSNLNLLVLRGQARLDQLAKISGPDTYDMETNPNGTQRKLDPKHAKEVLTYALDALLEDSSQDPRLFPEILLNARDQNVVEIYELDDPESELDFSSLMSKDEFDAHLVGVRIRLDALEDVSAGVAPQISRVDGNHRLAGTDVLLAQQQKDPSDESVEFPQIPFSLLVGVSQTQEAKLFRDINGEHKGMETAHLDSIMVRITDNDVLKSDPDYKKRALWLAYELSKPGRAFENRVFMGGSTAGVRAKGGVPPLRITTLKTALVQLLNSDQEVSTMLAGQPDVQLVLVDSYWKAVKSLFPEAWKDKNGYILLQTIGLGAFSLYGGILIRKAVAAQRADTEFFEAHLKTVKDKVPLDRKHWVGVAGAGGVKRVADDLVASSSDAAASIEALKVKLVPEKSLTEKIGEVAGNQAGDEGP